MPPHEDSSNIVANMLARKLVDQTQSINLRLFLVKSKPDARVDASVDLKRKRFVHSDLLRDVIFPYQEEKGVEKAHPAAMLSPKLLTEKYSGRVFVEPVDNINDPAFIEQRIRGNPYLRMAVSVRNLQIFHDPIIQAFQEKGEASLMNSHPAQLPGVRGLEGPFWSRYLGMDEYTTTLHVVVRQIDAGAILDYESRAVNGDAEKPVMNFLRDVAPNVADMIYRQIHIRLLRHGSHRGLTLQEGDVGYYSLPNQEEIDLAKKKGIVMSDPFDQISWLAKTYGPSAKNQDIGNRWLLKKLVEAHIAFETELGDMKPSPVTSNRPVLSLTTEEDNLHIKSFG